MKVSIRDMSALLAVSPVRLSAYARVAGWSREEPYGVHSDVYVGRELLLVVIIPSTDVIRIQALDHDHGAGISIGASANLLCGAREMILAGACSVDNPIPLYQPGVNKKADDFLRRVRLDPTAQANFPVTLLSPVAPPPLWIPPADVGPYDEPVERRVTRRLAEALAAARRATDDTRGAARTRFLQP